MVLAALDSRAASTIGDQCLFLQPMQSASIFKSIFDFRIFIPSVRSMTFYHWTCFVTQNISSNEEKLQNINSIKTIKGRGYVIML